jgi:hypothetical protein
LLGFSAGRLRRFQTGLPDFKYTGQILRPGEQRVKVNKKMGKGSVKYFPAILKYFNIALMRP